MVWCAALYCKSDSRLTKHLRFYSFPADEERRKKWEFVCQRKNWQASKFAKLCEKHFDESQYEMNRKDGWKKLKPNAVPSITNVSVRLERLPVSTGIRCLKTELTSTGDEAKDISDLDYAESNALESNRFVKQKSGIKGAQLQKQKLRHEKDRKQKLMQNADQEICIPQKSSSTLGTRRKRTRLPAISSQDSQNSGVESDSSAEIECPAKAKHRQTNADSETANLFGSPLAKCYTNGSLKEQNNDKTLGKTKPSVSQIEDSESPEHCLASDLQTDNSAMANRLASLRSEDRGNHKIAFGVSRPQTLCFDLERHMHDKEENLMKEWDTTVKYRQEDSLSIRPLSVASDDSVKTGSMQIGASKKTPSLAETSSGVLSFDFPEIDVVKRHDTSLNDSAEIVEDDSRRFTYFDCPDTGQKYMKMDLNVEGFEPKDITVKSLGGRLTIHGISHTIFNGTRHTNEFCKKIKLPNEVAAENVRCTFSDHVLVLEAPVKAQHLSNNQETTKLPLNRPVVLSDENGKYLSLTVELGQLFKPCDVVVKVKGQQTVIITAETVENTAFSRMKAKLEREFDLPAKIDRKSLKAGCTSDFLLKIVARVKTESLASDSSNLIDTGGYVL